ncbi:hypothetical protein Tco_1060342 [Tanacetum coccineum]
MRNACLTVKLEISNHYPLSAFIAMTCAKMTEQKRKKPKKLEHNANHLQSITSVLQGIIFHSDIKVSVNCALCIAMVVDLENYVQKDNWYRLITEEMVMSLAVPGLASKSIMAHNRPAVHIVVSMLELQQVPSWMSVVFDDSCISGIIQNLSPGNITREMVPLFWELLQSGHLNSKHISCLNKLFQVIRKPAQIEVEVPHWVGWVTGQHSSSFWLHQFLLEKGTSDDQKEKK